MTAQERPPPPGIPYPVNAPSATLAGEPLSPELALVDPELAARARAALPVPILDADPAPPRRVEAPPARRSRSGLLRRATLLVLLASLTLNAELLLERRQDAPQQSATPAPRVRGVSAAVAVKKADPRQPLSLPKPAQPPKVVRDKLRWRRSPAATRYDIVIWRGHRRVLDVWTTRPRVDLAALPCVQRRRLEAGRRYLWFVYPMLRQKPAARFGKLLRFGVVEPTRQALSC